MQRLVRLGFLARMTDSSDILSHSLVSSFPTMCRRSGLVRSPQVAIRDHTRERWRHQWRYDTRSKKGMRIGYREEISAYIPNGERVMFILEEMEHRRATSMPSPQASDPKGKPKGCGLQEGPAFAIAPPRICPLTDSQYHCGLPIVS